MSGLTGAPVAWVTGSSRGLGRALAARLGCLGARLAVHDEQPDSPAAFAEGDSVERVARDLARETDGATTWVCGDLTDPAAVTAAADAIRRQWGRIDILVANAGGNIGAGGTAAGLAGLPSPDDPCARPSPTSARCSTATSSRACSAAGKWRRRCRSDGAAAS